MTTNTNTHTTCTVQSLLAQVKNPLALHLTVGTKAGQGILLARVGLLRALGEWKDQLVDVFSNQKGTGWGSSYVTLNVLPHYAVFEVWTSGIDADTVADYRVAYDGTAEARELFQAIQQRGGHVPTAQVDVTTLKVVMENGIGVGGLLAVAPAITTRLTMTSNATPLRPARRGDYLLAYTVPPSAIPVPPSTAVTIDDLLA